MRAFVAIAIDEAVRQALGALIAEWRARHAEVKWVEPGNIHLTLKFLGAVPDERVPQVVETLRACVRGVKPFELRVQGAGAFPSPRRPRVLFVAAEAVPPLAVEVANRLNEQMAALGVEREDRPFQSHLTLGRLREPRPLPGVAEKIEALQGHRFGVMTVREITLFKSDLHPRGPKYTPVEVAALEGDTST